MGLRKKIIAVLEEKGLDVTAALLKISAIAREPKKVKDKPLVTFEVRKEPSTEGSKTYRIDALGSQPVPTSAVVALQQALEGYKNQVAFYDCSDCEAEKAIQKSRGEV